MLFHPLLFLGVGSIFKFCAFPGLGEAVLFAPGVSMVLSSHLLWAHLLFLPRLSGGNGQDPSLLRPHPPLRKIAEGLAVP